LTEAPFLGGGEGWRVLLLARGPQVRGREVDELPFHSEGKKPPSGGKGKKGFLQRSTPYPLEKLKRSLWRRRKKREETILHSGGGGGFSIVTFNWGGSYLKKKRGN